MSKWLANQVTETRHWGNTSDPVRRPPHAITSAIRQTQTSLMGKYIGQRHQACIPNAFDHPVLFMASSTGKANGEPLQRMLSNLPLSLQVQEPYPLSPTLKSTKPPTKPMPPVSNRYRHSPLGPVSQDPEVQYLAMYVQQMPLSDPDGTPHGRLRGLKSG